MPISSPHGPRKIGANEINKPVAVLDLSAMRKLVFADKNDSIALIEPGLTFGELDDALKPHGMRSVKPLLPRASKSVLACFLDRTPTIGPADHWDSMDPLSSFSLIFGSGDKFRTGGAALPGSREEQIENGNRYLNSVGPSTTDYGRVMMGSRGTLGVVCWASIFCEQIPAAEKAFLVGASEVQPLLDIVYECCMRKMGQHILILDRAQLAAALANDSVEFEQINQSDLPKWCLYLSLAASDINPDGSMAWQEEDLHNLIAEFSTEDVTSDNSEWVKRFQSALQTPQEQYYKETPKGHYKEVFCLTQSSNAAALCDKAQAFLEQKCPQNVTSSCYVQSMVQGVSCHVEFSLFFDNPEQESEVAAIADELSKLLAEAGGFFSRPYGNQVEDAFARNPDLVPHLKRVKNLFDPAGVLAPGHLCF